MSVVSSTDVEVFRRLSNPEVVDFNASSTRQITQQLREAMERAVSSSEPHEEGGVAEASRPTSPALPERTPPPPERAPAASGSFSSAVQALSTAARQASLPSSLPVPAQSASLPSPLQVPAQSATLRPIAEDEESSDAEEGLPVRPAQASSAPLGIGGRSRSSEPAVAERPSSSPPPASAVPRYLSSTTASDEEETRLEKQGLLLDLHALQTKGVRLTREFTMNDSVTELEFELQKQTALQNACSAVQNMKDMLRIGFNGMELLNAKMGPFICMDGWAESLTTDMKRFDAPLEKIYKRYWRKSSMSPVMELGMIILGSLAMHHFKLKVFGRPSAGAAASDTAHQPTHRSAAAEEAPTGAATSSSSAVRARRRPPNDGLRSTRPVLRSPMSLLGG